MIIVVADDFTGAAEIGGVGLKYGFSVEIFTKWPVSSDADLLIFATNTRSKSLEEASKETGALSIYIRSLNPEWVFKKIDSVLRGHILEETEVMMKTLQDKSTIIIPANPHLNRFVKGGEYFIGNVPILETSFAHDPEFSIDSSTVTEILSKRDRIEELHYQLPDSIQQIKGIIVGEVKDNSDMEKWASIRNGGMLSVGASSYFEAILKSRGYIKRINDIRSPDQNFEKRIVICGSAYHGSREFVKKAKDSGFPVSYMNDRLFDNEEINVQDIKSWKEEIIDLLQDHDQVILAISHPVVKKKRTTENLKKIVAETVKAVHRELNITEFLIEGGATAFEVLDLLEFTTLIPVCLYNQGVIKLKVKETENINIVLKPGSYKWPEKVLAID